MKTISEKLKKPFLTLAERRSVSKSELGDYLKWLRFYLDFCAKYGHPPRDSDSLPLFMQKLASRGQNSMKQKQAAAAVVLYYDVISEWCSMIDSGVDAPIEKNSWDTCYKLLKEEIALRHYSPKTLKTYRTWIIQFQMWLKGKLPEDVDSKDARGFLTHLAVNKKVAASTQNQAFNALLFLYKHILGMEHDIAAGYDGVFMPNALGRKWATASKELIWQWVFPAKMITLVPQTKEHRRYHLHETKLQKALRAAVRSSGVMKRVTCHTFRHSFASHLLRANYDIRTIQQLLGHADVKTTMIYTHTVRSRTIKEIESPLDFPKDIVKTLEGFAGGVMR